MGWWSDAVSAAKERLMTDHRMIRGVRVTVTNTRPDIETTRVFEKLDGRWASSNGISRTGSGGFDGTFAASS
jgi:hypothetical protein